MGTTAGTECEGAGEGRHLQRSQQFRGCVRGRQWRHQSIAGVEGPVLDLAECALEGTHNAENLMAAWLVGRAMKLLPAEMVPVLQTLEPASTVVSSWRSGGCALLQRPKLPMHALVSALRSCRRQSSSPECLAHCRRARQGDGLSGGGFSGGTGQGAWLIELRLQKFSLPEPFCALQLAADLIEAIAEAGRNAAPRCCCCAACASFDIFDSYQHRGNQSEPPTEWVGQGKTIDRQRSSGQPRQRVIFMLLASLAHSVLRVPTAPSMRVALLGAT